MELQDDPSTLFVWLFVIGTQKKGQEWALDPDRRLDHEGQKARRRLFLEVGQILTASLGMLLQVEIGSVGGPHELGPAEGPVEHEIGGLLRVVSELTGGNLIQLQILGPKPV